MFTFRDFEGGTLGLAWTGDLKNAGVVEVDDGDEDEDVVVALEDVMAMAVDDEIGAGIVEDEVAEVVILGNEEIVDIDEVEHVQVEDEGLVYLPYGLPDLIVLVPGSMWYFHYSVWLEDNREMLVRLIRQKLDAYTGFPQGLSWSSCMVHGDFRHYLDCAVSILTDHLLAAVDVSQAPMPSDLEIHSIFCFISFISMWLVS